MEVSFTIPANSKFSINVKPAGGDGSNVNGEAHVQVLASSGFTLNMRPLGGLVSDRNVKTEPTKVSEPCLKMAANPRVFFDFTVKGTPFGRVVMELFADTTPRTAENFRCLCTGEKGMGKLGKPLHYKGSIIHSVDPGFMLCGGDFTAIDGTGGECIYEDRFFEDENFFNKLEGPGYLAMSNRGPDTNGSQFMLCMTKIDLIDTEHVVFAKVVQGLYVINNIMQEVGYTVYAYDKSKPVVIADCGQIS